MVLQGAGSVRVFALATLCPAGLVCLAAIFGGIWAWLSVGYLTVLVFALDRLIAGAADKADPEAEFPAADPLLIALGLLHFLLIAICLWAFSPAAPSATIEVILIALAAGLIFGQISHPVAHELIHSPRPGLRLLGKVIYTSLLIGHHASAHVRIHHVFVGSDKDPNSPRRGEGFYRYALRASRQSFLAALTDENRLFVKGRKTWLLHPYLLYITGGVVMLMLSVLTAGPLGLVGFALVTLHAQMQILMSDYVQHYGLRRQEMPDGVLEPIGPQHSWNAPHWFSSALMLNATRHSHHHVNPRVPFPALELDHDAMPMLPYPLPVMAVLALNPMLWHRLMDKRCAKWNRRPWHPRKTITSPCDLPPETQLAKKSGGTRPRRLPNTTHESDLFDPVSAVSFTRRRAKPDERSGI